MKHILIVATLIFSSAAWTKTTDNLSILNKILTAAEGQPSNGNGPSIRKYDLKRFDIKNEIEKMNAKYNTPGNDCRYDIVVGRRKNISLLKSDRSIQGDASIVSGLELLQKNTQLTSIISAIWDGDSGDSEYCMIYDFNVYTADGYLLNMEFNHTD